MKFSSYIKVRNGKPYFRMVVPSHRRRRSAQENCFRLDTDSLGEANRLAGPLAAYFAALCDDVRKRLQPAQPLSERVVKALKPVAEILTKRLVLSEDDQLRDHDLAQLTQLSSFLAAHHLKPATTSAQFLEQSRARVDEQVARMAQELKTSPARWPRGSHRGHNPRVHEHRAGRDQRNQRRDAGIVTGDTRGNPERLSGRAGPLSRRRGAHPRQRKNKWMRSSRRWMRRRSPRPVARKIGRLRTFSSNGNASMARTRRPRIAFVPHYASWRALLAPMRRLRQCCQFAKRQR